MKPQSPVIDITQWLMLEGTSTSLLGLVLNICAYVLLLIAKIKQLYDVTATSWPSVKKDLCHATAKKPHKHFTKSVIWKSCEMVPLLQTTWRRAQQGQRVIWKVPYVGSKVEGF